MLSSFLKFVSGKWAITPVTVNDPLPMRTVVDGSDVSSSNPLPTMAQAGTSTSGDAQAGRLHIIRATKSAVAGEFARLQIHNAGSAPLQIATIQVWGGSAGTHLYSLYKVNTPNVSSPVVGAVTNCRLGTVANAEIEVYGNSSATAITTANILGQTSSAVIAAPGSTLLQSGIQVTIQAGETIEVAIGTANVAFTMVVAASVIE